MVTLILATLAGLAGIGLALSFDPINEIESESE